MFLDFVPRTLVPLIVLLEQKTWSVSLKKEWTVHFSLTYEATRISLFLIRKQFHYKKFMYNRYLISSNFSKGVLRIRIRFINTSLQNLNMIYFIYQLILHWRKEWVQSFSCRSNTQYNHCACALATQAN